MSMLWLRLSTAPETRDVTAPNRTVSFYLTVLLFCTCVLDRPTAGSRTAAPAGNPGCLSDSIIPPTSRALVNEDCQSIKLWESKEGAPSPSGRRNSNAIIHDFLVRLSFSLLRRRVTQP